MTGRLKEVSLFVEAHVLGVFAEFDVPAKIIDYLLLGSAAAGTMDEWSDYDIGLIVNYDLRKVPNRKEVNRALSHVLRHSWLADYHDTDRFIQFSVIYPQDLFNSLHGPDKPLGISLLNGTVIKDTEAARARYGGRVDFN